MVVGAYAMALHDQPRATSDVDVFVEASAANAKRVMAVLTDFGFGKVGLESADFEMPGRTVQLGYPPNRIDLITSIDGVTFTEASRRARRVPYGRARIRVIGLRDLIRNKETAGREKDLVDAKNLRRNLRK